MQQIGMKLHLNAIYSAHHLQAILVDVIHQYRQFTQSHRCQTFMHHLNSGALLANYHDGFLLRQRICHDVDNGLGLTRSRRPLQNDQGIGFL